VELLKYSWHQSEELGKVTFLSTKERPYKEGEPCTVRITATDGLITVYIGDEKVIEAYDNEAFLSGYTGFYLPAGEMYFKDVTFYQIEK
jgi:hypothetical protein